MSQWQVFSLGKSGCFMQPIQMQLSLKLKICSQFFSAFLKSTSNFEHFEENGEPYSWCIYEIIECKMCGCLNA